MMKGRCGTLQGHTEGRLLIMIHRTARIVLLLTVIYATSVATDARACGPTTWRADTADLPECVTVGQVGGDDWEVRNDCDASLALSNDTCDACAVPNTVAAGDVALVELFDPGDQDAAVDVMWQLDGQEGVVAFTRPIGRCPEGACTASPSSRGSFAWMLALVGTTALVSRRARRDPRTPH